MNYDGELIIKMEFGSKLYGTSMPESDLDYKSIHIPNTKDILLQRAKGSHIRGSSKQMGVKNGPKDIDHESISLQFYINSLTSGQTFALDMAFAPRDMWIQTGDKLWIWQGIIENKDLLISRSSVSFMGYAKSQANKYGEKGKKITALKLAIRFLESFDPLKTLKDIEPMLDRFVYPGDLYSGDGSDLLITYKTIKGEKHLDICGKMTPMHSKVHKALGLYRKVLDTYGSRSMASHYGGIDLKACMHALRIINEGIELFKTGNITFPRPEAEYLRSIRRGEVSNEKIEDAIEASFIELKNCHKNSMLRESPDLDFANDLICSVYGESIREEFNKKD
jgi:hypothetical protein